MTILYGIRNCDTVKKARAWLDEYGVGYDFHDYKVSGIDPALLNVWADALGWEKMLNRAGTTFRQLPDDDKAGLDRVRAVRLMSAHPTLIKRPVLEHRGGLIVGFRAETYAAAFAR